MSTEPASPPPPVDVGALRRQAALHEFLEVLVLRQRAAAAGVVGTIVLALLVTAVAPGVLTASALTGLVVGLLSLAVGTGLAFVVHHQDPVLRAPGQARWDGGSVLAWVASLRTADDVAPALAVFQERVTAVGRHRVLLLDGGGGAREAGGALGVAAAAAGIRTLLVDLTDERPQPGMAAVGDGSARLVDAVEMDEDRELARIGAGRRLLDSVTGTVDLLDRPNRDLELVLVVGPDDQDARAALRTSVDRVVVVVTAGSRERAAVRDTLARASARASAELLLVGGHLTDTAPTRHEPESSPGAPPSTDAVDAPPVPAPPQVALLSRHRAGVAPPSRPPGSDDEVVPPTTAPPAVTPAPVPASPPAGATVAPPPAPPSIRDPQDLDDRSSHARVAAPAPRSLHAAPPPGRDLPHATPRTSDGHVRVVRATGGTPTTVPTAVPATAPADPPPPAPRRVAEVDTSWQFRPFRSDETDDADAVEDAAAVAPHADEADATAEAGAGAPVRAPRTTTAEDPRPARIDLAEPRDLVTTATLEFLSGDWDDRI